jgi:uncharacterized protein (TIGR00661 family)
MKSYRYLRQYFGDRVNQVTGLSLSYSNGKLSTLGTVGVNLKKFPSGTVKNYKLYKNTVKSFAPDLVISDYEPFLAWWAFRHRVPCITIDHQNTLTQLKLDHVEKSFFSRFSANFITRCYYPGRMHHIIINFFNAPVKSKRSVLVGPVIRNEVAQRAPQKGNAVVVYTTDPTLKQKMIETFSKFQQVEFRIYGLDQEFTVQNCRFFKTSTDEFLDDLSTARAVIGTAGFSMISECLYFRKKMLLLPLKGQYEQVLNAHYVKKLGLGTYDFSITEDSVSQLLKMAETDISSDPDILWPDNEKYLAVLDEKIMQITAR